MDLPLDWFPSFLADCTRRTSFHYGILGIAFDCLDIHFHILTFPLLAGDFTVKFASVIRHPNANLPRNQICGFLCLRWEAAGSPSALACYFWLPRRILTILARNFQIFVI